MMKMASSFHMAHFAILITGTFCDDRGLEVRLYL
jgi:hypothetical protein